MPHDRNGNILQVGDQVTVQAKITSILMNEEYCNLTAETLEPMFPSDNKTCITLNTRQVVKVQHEAMPESKDSAVA